MDTTIPPLGVTVAIGQFGRQEYLEGAVESVLAQTGPLPKLELIVSKDFSEPGLDRRLRQCGATVLDSSGSRLGEMLASQVSAARGDVICFLDDDDRFLPSKLAHAVECFRRSPDLAYYHNAETSSPRPRPASIRVGPGELHPREVARVYRYIGGGNSSSISVRRQFLLPFVPYLARIASSPDVFFLLAAMAARKEILADDWLLTEVTVHRGSTSRPQTAESVREQDALVLRSAPPMQEMMSGIGGARALAEFGELAARFDLSGFGPEFYRPAARDYLRLARVSLSLGQPMMLLRGVAWSAGARLAPHWSGAEYARRRLGRAGTD